MIDLKYGKGVPVSQRRAIPSCGSYALGAALKYWIVYGFGEVRMTIVQPRLGSVSTDAMPYDELIDWAETYVEPRARAADEGRGEYNPGEAQCRWCKAKAVCRARAEANLQAACEDFSLDDLPEDPAEAGAALRSPGCSAIAEVVAPPLLPASRLGQ